MKRVKTASTESAGVFDVRKAILKELANVQYVNKVAVDIYGKIHYLDEAHIRALQVVAAKVALLGEAAFKEFTDNVVVYSGRDITHSTHVMHWQSSGKFVETFDKGFYSANDDLTEKLYDVADMEEEYTNQWLLSNSSNLEALATEQRASECYSPEQEDNTSYPLGEHNACLRAQKVWAEVAKTVGTDEALRLSEEEYNDLTEK